MPARSHYVNIIELSEMCVAERNAFASIDAGNASGDVGPE
jgi:hypothetical protein